MAQLFTCAVKNYCFSILFSFLVYEKYEKAMEFISRWDSVSVVW